MMAALSLDKRLVSEPLARRSFNEAIQPGKRVMFHVTVVQTECELVNIAIQVLGASVVIYANEPALENGENALHSICRHIITDIFAGAVVDCLMGETGRFDPVIRCGFVSVQRRARFDILANSGLDSLLVSGFDRHSDRFSAALAHSENGRLADCSAPSLELLGLCACSFRCRQHRSRQSRRCLGASRDQDRTLRAGDAARTKPIFE